MAEFCKRTPLIMGDGLRWVQRLHVFLVFHVFHALQGVTREDLDSAQPDQEQDGEPLAVRDDGVEAAQTESTEVEAARKAERERRAAKAEVCCLCHICLSTLRHLSPQPTQYHMRTAELAFSRQQ